MSLIADGVLIATCLTTALYCLILSRRLRRLSDTGEGVGQQILRLNTALNETRAAVEEIRSSAGSASDRLQHDVETAKRQSHQLQLQIARALKSGAGGHDVPTRSASGPADDRTAKDERPGRYRDVSATRDWAVSLGPAAGLDAVEPLEDELDDGFGAADAGNADGDVTEGEAAVPSDTTGEYVETGDVSEAENHWPFDETEAANEPIDLSADDSLGDGPRYAAGEAVETVQTRGRSPGRGEHPGASDTGLLRVERMAV